MGGDAILGDENSCLFIIVGEDSDRQDSGYLIYVAIHTPLFQSGVRTG